MISEVEKAQILQNISYQTEYTNFEKVDLIIETVFEDIDVKQRVLREVEPYLRPDCVIATNTGRENPECCENQGFTT